MQVQRNLKAGDRDLKIAIAFFLKRKPLATNDLHVRVDVLVRR
jgi:hypothetical protein